MIEIPTRARPRRQGGDPLDGLVNLFDLGIVLAVAFLLAALSSLKLSDLLTAENVTVVRSGQGSNTVIVKKGQRVRTVELQGRGSSARAADRLGLPPRGRPHRVRRAALSVAGSAVGAIARAAGELDRGGAQAAGRVDRLGEGDPRGRRAALRVEVEIEPVAVDRRAGGGDRVRIAAERRAMTSSASA